MTGHRAGVSAAACLLLLAAACTGGSKQNQTASPAAITQPVPRTAPPSVATVVATTPQPAARAATPGRQPPSTAALATPPGATAVPLGAGATRDTTLQQQLEAAVLQAGDLPAGFGQDGDLDRDLDDPTETAAAALTFTRADQSSGGLAIQAVYVGLAGFKDVASAQAELQSLPQSFQQNAGGDFRVQPISGAPAIGDDTQAYRVDGTTDNITVSGFALLWRRDRVAAVVIEVATPALPGIDPVTALAKLQDARIQGLH